jgi:hypothetical protein
MPFTAQEINNIANASLDFFMKGPAMAQTLEQRPTLKAMRAAQKTFPGGKEAIVGNVKGEYTTTMTGYSGDDTVTYGNPANLKQWNYPWRELHGGIAVTATELKKDGITIVDTNGAETVTHSGADLTRITSLFADKLDDMAEGSARGMNEILWRDGSQDAKAFPGIQSIILPTATAATGVTGGIDRAANWWWRNRALTGASKITASAANQTLTRTLRDEARQLIRYGGKPSLLPAGSAFLSRLEMEVQEKGIYTQQGFANNGKTDIGMADISMRGVGTFYYEPELDNLGLQYFAYFLDPRRLFLDVMEDEDMKQHNPNSPAEKYVIYRSVTWTGGLVAQQLNCHGVYEVAA